MDRPDPAPDAGKPSTLGDLLRRVGVADPATVLLDTPGRPPVTYGDADRGSARLAHALVDLGVRPGDRVAVQIAKSAQAVLLYLACVRAGAVFLPLNPAYTDAEVDHVVADAGPVVVVVDPARARAAGPGPGVARPTVGADGEGSLAALAERQPDHFADVPVGPDDTAAMLYTSGTTGRPKGAVLSHRNLASNAVALHRAWGFRPDDVLLHALPVFHLHGLFVAINCVLLNGTGMVFLPRFDVDDVVANLPRSTVYMGVPTHYSRMLADARLDRSLCLGVRLFVSGSAPLPARTHEEFEARTGHRILERYGMTETSIITSNPLDGERRAGTVGFPLPGVSVRLVDRSGVPVPPGAPGQIEVSGESVFSGYWRRPDATTNEFATDGFFRTGDLGQMDADGYLRIVGRARDLIISGGLNVYPREVEEVLDGLDGIQESAVIGVPDPDLGEAVVAVVVAVPGRRIDGATVRAAARERLAGFKVPKRVQVVDALPRNDMGKVAKSVLRAAQVEST